ncbi:uncharacterized protein dgt3 isoform X1 [Panulirus ornatus]|uniref:uncharacterized protein dgt3 isoform X1 n=1 Tax=Panulirus ornatus TaxID=150431 RepID=UPI003A864CFE
MMDGDRLVAHLKVLRIPGAERLEGANYDWFLQSDVSTPLATFLEWFTENVSANDILTDAELNEYEELMSKGEVLTGHQLEDMEACLSGLSGVFTSSEGENQQDVFTLEEHERLKDQLEVLTMRKNHLSAHKIELREEAYQCSERLKAAETHLKKHQEAALNTSHHLSRVQEELAGSLDALTNVFLTFDKTPVEEAKFFTQLKLEEWYHEEAKFTDVLKTYIRRQFREGVREVAGAGDTSEHCLLDVDNLDLHLVHGAGKAEYAQNVAELNRLSKLLQQTEEWRLEGLLLQARRRAEVEEATKMLSAIHRSQLPSALPLLQQQTHEAKESCKVLEQERQQQHLVMQSLVAEVAQLESTRTISGNYQLKSQRQEYFLDKQKIVMEQLVSQVARYNWINIALDIEKGKISNILEVLKNINSIITHKDDSYRERMKRYGAMVKEHKEQKGVGQLPPPLVTLSHLLPITSKLKLQDEQVDGVVNAKILQKQASMLQSAINTAREHVSTARNPQFSRLNRMTMNSAVLETSLFGSPGSLGALPVAWLDPKLVEHYTALDQESWKFKQKLLKLIVEYEEKKKILQIEPTVREEFTKWTSNVIKALT